MIAIIVIFVLGLLPIIFLFYAKKHSNELNSFLDFRNRPKGFYKLILGFIGFSICSTYVIVSSTIFAVTAEVLPGAFVVGNILGVVFCIWLMHALLNRLNEKSSAVILNVEFLFSALFAFFLCVPAFAFSESLNFSNIVYIVCFSSLAVAALWLKFHPAKISNENVDFNEQSQNVLNHAFHVPAPPPVKDESEKYKDFKLSPIEDAPKEPSPVQKKHSDISYKPLILAALTLALLIGFLAIFSDPLPNATSSSAQSESVNSTSSKPTPNTTDLAVLPKPSTGLILSYDNADAVAPFEVTASAGRDYFLVLSQNGKAQRCYYIRHGETLSVSVPLGTYDLYYASATIQAAWHGDTELWGTNTEFYKSDDIWKFTLEDGYYIGYTLSLTTTSNDSNETSEYTWDNLFE